jgi:hypothetical protein
VEARGIEPRSEASLARSGVAKSWKTRKRLPEGELQRACGITSVAADDRSKVARFARSYLIRSQLNANVGRTNGVSDARS